MGFFNGHDIYDRDMGGRGRCVCMRAFSSQLNLAFLQHHHKRQGHRWSRGVFCFFFFQHVDTCSHHRKIIPAFCSLEDGFPCSNASSPFSRLLHPRRKGEPTLNPLCNFLSKSQEWYKAHQRTPTLDIVPTIRRLPLWRSVSYDQPREIRRATPL